MIPHPVGSLRKPVHRWVWTVLVSLVAGASAATAMLEHGLATTLGFGLGCAAVAGAIVVKVMRASMRRKPVVTASQPVIPGSRAATRLRELGWPWPDRTPGGCRP